MCVSAVVSSGLSSENALTVLVTHAKIQNAMEMLFQAVNVSDAHRELLVADTEHMHYHVTHVLVIVRCTGYCRCTRVRLLL